MNTDEIINYLEDKLSEFDNFQHLYYVKYKKSNYLVKYFDLFDVEFKGIQKILINSLTSWSIWTKKTGWNDLSIQSFDQLMDQYKIQTHSDYENKQLKRRHGRHHHDEDDDDFEHYIENFRKIGFIQEKNPTENIRSETHVEIFFRGDDLRKIFKIVH